MIDQCYQGHRPSPKIDVNNHYELSTEKDSWRWKKENFLSSVEKLCLFPNKVSGEDKAVSLRELRNV